MVVVGTRRLTANGNDEEEEEEVFNTTYFDPSGSDT
jgi:hypothetical protein